jgi:hypothetical protein
MEKGKNTARSRPYSVGLRLKYAYETLVYEL